MRHLLEEGKMLVVKGKVDFRNDKPNVLVQDIWDLSEWESKRIRSCVLKFNAEEVDQEQLKALYTHLENNKGDCQVYFDIPSSKCCCAIKNPPLLRTALLDLLVWKHLRNSVSPNHRDLPQRLQRGIQRV